MLHVGILLDRFHYVKGCLTSLKRPLIYKGPSDHLTQFFKLGQLYKGMQLLLQDSLMDWQYQKDELMVNGVFFYENRLIKTCLAWPMLHEQGVNSCDCEENANSNENCDHLAALAIESKTHLDQLPQSIKQTEAYPKAHDYLIHWLSLQSFDPFPNMARHRVVYILDEDNLIDSSGNHLESHSEKDSENTANKSKQFSISIHKAYLSQKNEYQRKADLPLDTINKSKLPKFLSLADQQIFYQINKMLKNMPQFKLAENTIVLPCVENKTFDSTELDNLVKYLVESGRLFWKTCHRHPLKFEQQKKPQNDWYCLANHFYFDKSGGEIVQVNQKDDDELSNFIENLQQPDSQYSLQDSPQHKYQLTPCLELTSQQVVLGFAKQAIDIDIAQIKLLSGEKRISLQSLLNRYLNEYKASHSTTNQNKWQFLEEVISYIHQIDTLPGIASRFEMPISQKFNRTDRFFEGNFEHWLPLLRGLQLEGWKIVINNNFSMNKRSIQSWYSKVIPAVNNNQLVIQEEHENVFDLEVGIQVDGKQINLMPYIVNALKQGQNFNDLNFNNAHENNRDKNSDQEITPDLFVLTLNDGTRIELPYKRINNILNHLLELYNKNPLTTEEHLRLPINQAHRLLELEKCTDKIKWENASWIKKKAQSLISNQGVVEVKIPKNLKATLRGYQYDGFNWLQFLTREGLSGILADDMGLGKTVQTLAHIQKEKNSGRMTSPCMVVAPTSLLGNWLSESARFTPNLKTIYWAGSKRESLKNQLAKSDLIITSYGLLLRDANLLNRSDIYLLILDEAQAIKNSRSKVSKIAYSMQSKCRLCLTGTPLENHLGELWSLFHFLMPGLLGNESSFKRLFREPIEKHDDFVRQKILNQRIAPFILRRTKDKVASDLPKKTLIQELIELSDSQADLYESVRLSMLEEIQSAANLSKAAGNQLLISNALLRLRQICCHSRLVDKIFRREEDNITIKSELLSTLKTKPYQNDFFNNEGEQQKIETTQTKTMQVIPSMQIRNNDNLIEHLISDSAKLNWLNTKLPEMIFNGRKILIFSSFTSMLDIIAKLLDALSISYLVLTGKTTNRTKIVNQFQKGNASVFLISLKAGGAGLNLTQADTVIHFDPWWNPAAENQASDRAHRIGQDKPVFVYKLITRGTIEERIGKMQQDKSQLANKIYQEVEKIVAIKEIDWKKLLAPIDEDLFNH